MQSTFQHLVRQQVVLKTLGYYKGPVDGVWGPMTIEAKKRFESDPSFLPGLPNNGMPFGHTKPWPVGFTQDIRTGLLAVPGMEQFMHEETEALKIGPARRDQPRSGGKKKSQAQQTSTPPEDSATATTEP